MLINTGTQDHVIRLNPLNRLLDWSSKRNRN